MKVTDKAPVEMVERAYFKIWRVKNRIARKNWSTRYLV